MINLLITSLMEVKQIVIMKVVAKVITKVISKVIMKVITKVIKNEKLFVTFSIINASNVFIV